jgi:hypothetical protein
VNSLYRSRPSGGDETIQVLLKHPKTGDATLAAVGWSWSLFLGAGGLLGIPLFFRGLALWGTVVFTLWSLRLALPLLAGTGAAIGPLDWGLTIFLAGLSVYFGARGNALRARRYLARGYTFARPDSLEARLAASRWGV